MGVKTHTTAIVLIPPNELWPSIQAIRKKHDRQVRRWMPHVTLIYPFRPREEFDALAAAFSEVCRSIRPFEVELAQFSSFHHGRESYTLWLRPEPQEPLVGLQQALHGVVPDCDDVTRHRNGFTPHLSVGQVRGKVAMMELLHSLQAGWRRLSFEASEVSLIWRGEPPDDVFCVDRTVELGGPNLRGGEG